MKLPGLPKREDPKRFNTIDLDFNTKTSLPSVGKLSTAMTPTPTPVPQNDPIPPTPTPTLRYCSTNSNFIFSMFGESDSDCQPE